MPNPFQVVRDFEAAVCDYTGAPYCVTTNSCTMALLLACKWAFRGMGRVRNCGVSIPSRTYVGVPMSIINAGGRVFFRDEEWCGMYRLKAEPFSPQFTGLPVTQSIDEYGVWDSARYFTSGMYVPGQMQCVSFHATKILGDTQGGAILLDDEHAYQYLKCMRFDGRSEGVPPNKDMFTEIGYHCYMSPDVAARLLHKLSVLPKHNKPLPNDDYPDLSTFEVFR
jgi:dTDP-4-amino-4,6-dideoxygalactose transaminase